MTNPRSPRQQITETVTAWPGVEAGPGRRGEFAFRVARHEIGHLHGDGSAHFSFPKAVWVTLMAARRIVPHPVFPAAQDPAARPIRRDQDLREVIELMRLNYDRIMLAA